MNEVLPGTIMVLSFTAALIFVLCAYWANQS